MKKLLTIAVAGLIVCGLNLNRATAEHPCCNPYICTPCGPIGQYNAFSPVYKEACCPQCGHPCHDKHCHLTQCNAFSPLVEDCTHHGWFSWLHHDCKAKPAGACMPSGCDWGCCGELPDTGTACAESGMKVFPQNAIPSQPINAGARPMPAVPPTIKPVPTSPEPLAAPTKK